MNLPSSLRASLDRRTHWLAPLAFVVALNGMATAIALWTIVERHDAVEHHLDVTLHNLTEVLSQDISSLLQRADLVVLNVIDQLESQRVDDAIPASRVDEIAVKAIARHPEIYAVRIANARGDVIRGGGVVRPGAVNVADREYFQTLKANPDIGPVFSKSIVGRIDGKPVIALARALHDSSGKFAGVVFAVVLSESLERHFSSLALGPHGRVTLRNSDRELVARYAKGADNVDAYGKAALPAVARKALADNPERGTFRSNSLLDGVDRIVTYQKVAGYPFLVFVGLGVDDSYADWKRSRNTTILLLAFFVCATIPLTWLAYRAWSRSRSAEQALRNSETRYRQTFENAPVGVASLSLQCRFTDVNDSFTKLLGYTREESKGMNVTDIIDSEFLPADERKMQQLLAGEIAGFQAERRYIRKDRRAFWASISTSLTRGENGAPDHIILVIEDIEARKRAEATLVSMNTQLELAVAERTRNLVEANNDLQTITYTLAHDIRVPAQHTATFAEMIAEHYGTLLDERASRWLVLIISSAKRQAMLVEDMLDYLKLGTKTIERKRIDMNALVAAVEAGIDEESAMRTKIEWRNGDLPEALGDEGFIRVILTNLLSNAAKFSSHLPQSIVEVTSEKGPQGEDVYVVRDNGAGFDPARTSKMFGLFQRFHDAKAFPGTGVGLAIVKLLIEKHVGRIWVESSPGTGSTFYFTLQAAGEKT